MNRQLRTAAAAAAAGLLAVGFGVGYGAATGFHGGQGGSFFRANSEGGSSGKEPGGFNWFGFGKPRSADARRAKRGKPEGFTVWTQRVDTSHAQPQACIRMTRTLDPGRRYADYVEVWPEIEGKPAVRVHDDELCIAGVGLSDRRVVLLAGLPAMSGEKLADNIDVEFSASEKPPYVGFAGDGVILPREDADGVGIETVNVSRLAIEVWRVPDRNLVRREIAAVEPAGEDDYLDDEQQKPDDEGRVIWKGEVAVQGRSGQRTTTVFPLGAVLKELKPGGYVIKAHDASGRPAALDAKPDSDDEEDSSADNIARAERWVIFTDMALSSYTGSGGLDAIVRSLKSAKTLSGLRVDLVAKNGETLAQATTDGSGHVHFAQPLLKGEGAGAAKMLMAYGPAADLAVLDLDRSPVDLSKQGVGGRLAGESLTAGRSAKTTVDGYLYADRGVYRPGETVHMVAMLRDAQARAVKDRKGVLVVKRPSGVEFARWSFDGAPTGAVTRDILLPKSAPRGRWSAQLQLDGVDEASGQLSFAVEDFSPQRLEVKAAADEKRPVSAGETRRIDVAARFLYGAPGAGLKTQADVRLRADPDPFPLFEGFQWGDAQAPFEEKFVDLGSTVTDGAGRAGVSLPADQVGDTNQPLVAALNASVFEPGGRPVREGLTLKVRPAGVYLGVKVNRTDSAKATAPVGFDLIAVDAFGRRVFSRGVTWTLVAENWNYDWFQQDGKWQWRRTSRDVVVGKGVVDLDKGEPQRVTRNLGWGDYRIELQDTAGAKTVVRFAAGWGAPAKDTEAPDMVRVSAGAKTHGQGDSIDVAIKAPYGGEAQVAVATDRLIDFTTVHVGADGAHVRLKSSAEWGGGAYVLVTVIQPRDPVSSPKPRRAVGLVYVPLEPRGRKLEVAIGTPALLDAKAPVDTPITVKGLKFGQRAHVTLAAVDEGILRLTKQESPDPVKWFFGKRALDVDYRDDYGRLLDPNLGAPANINFGGDEIGGEGLTTTPIKTVALWSGVVETGLDGKATVRLPAAMFNGQLRLMAVAWTDEAVGGASQAMTVREPVIAELDLPRFLAPGDRAFATLELHNVAGRPGLYTAVVNATNGIAAAVRKMVNLLLGQRLADHIPLNAPGTAGVGRVDLQVTGPGFSTATSYPIQTRVGWGAETRTFTELQRPGESYTPSPQMMGGLTAGSVTMDVSYSPFRGFDPAPVAAALSRYPYGCTEQLVSIAYPLLYADELSNDPRLKRIPAILADTAGKILDRQAMDGAFGLWRVGDGEADPWLGAYAADFLLEAQSRGAPIPQSAIDRALSAMRLVSRPEGYVSVSYQMDLPAYWAGSAEASTAATTRMRSRASAYALYVLAKGRHGDLARLRWYHDVQFAKEGSPLAKAQVGAGLAMMGDRARAHDSFVQAVNGLGYKDRDDWYQSPLRDLAGVVSLAYDAGEFTIARQLQARLGNAVKDPDSLNTQEQAQLLKAASRMLHAAGRIRITAQGAASLPSLGGPRWSIGRLASAHFTNAGSGALWRTVTVRGVPTTPPPAASNALSVDKQLFTFSGARADPSRLAQGDRIIILISGRSGEARSAPLVIDDALPAGFEVDTTLSTDDAKDGPFKFLGELSTPSVQEGRDDRYVAALHTEPGKPFAVAYVARAVTPGNFYLPGVTASDMYRPSTFARSAPSRAQIALAH